MRSSSSARWRCQAAPTRVCVDTGLAANPGIQLDWVIIPLARHPFDGGVAVGFETITLL